MKVPKHFELKRRMSGVAKPIIDVFLDHKSDSEKKEILKDALRRTKKGSKILAKGYKSRFGQSPIAYHNTLTRTLGFFESYYGVLAHELVHMLNKRFRNEYVLANGIEFYMNGDRGDFRIAQSNENLLLNYPNLARKERGISLHEYENGYYKTGNVFGLRAKLIESEIRVPGSGLFYLKLVDLGVSPKEAERQILSGAISEVTEFAQKYGKRWNEILNQK